MKRSKFLGKFQLLDFPKKILVTLSPDMGRGVGTSGRAVAFCPSKNPAVELAIFGSELLQIYSHLALVFY